MYTKQAYLIQQIKHQEKVEKYKEKDKPNVDRLRSNKIICFEIRHYYNT